MMPRYCATLKAKRYESKSLNRIVADKSHRVIVALALVYMLYHNCAKQNNRGLKQTDAAAERRRSTGKSPFKDDRAFCYCASCNIPLYASSSDS